MAEQFRVWAPSARTVELESGGRQTRMEALDGGWWTATSEAGPGYRFLVDGTPAPDPRSAFQPHGVHGESHRVEHGEFKWADHQWRGLELEPSTVIYELHVGTFTPEGTFAGAIAKLDHLVDLGVKAIEIMPVAEFSGKRGWGYDGVDLFAPHHAYGGPDGLKRLVDACHERGLGCILDCVYNHLGPEGNYLHVFGPYFTNRYATPWGQAVNLDARDSDEVRNLICDNAEMWLRDYHLDGLRLDAVHELVDISAVHILEALATRVHSLRAQLGRPLFLIAESDLNDPKLMHPRDAGGYALDAQWLDDFHHALHAVLTRERNGYYEDFGSIESLAKALRQGYVYDGRYSHYRGRTHGRYPAGLTGRNFVAYLQNHDQVGNRARGDRSSLLLSDGLLKVGAALVLTSPFVPMLFQGEEWAASTPFQYFTDHQDKGLAKSVSDGRRREFAAFGWKPDEVPDPQSESTFVNSKLNWDELYGETHRAIYQWHRDLIRLRQHPELRDGRMDLLATTFDERERWLLVRRGTIHVACNLSAEPRQLSLGRRAELLLASSAEIKSESGVISLPPEAVGIFRS